MHNQLITKHWIHIVLAAALLAVVLSACGQQGDTPTPTAVQSEATTAATPEELRPTETEAPLAARVNGEGISQDEFGAELLRLQDAQAELQKTSTPEEQHQQAMDELIDQVLLAQAAYTNGFELDDAALQARIDQLAEQAGGAGELESWQNANHYTPESFRAALARQAAAAWQRDRLVDSVAESGEQIHARQILLLSRETADAIYNQLQSGVDFSLLANQYDPQTGGELGWFPRGYLLQPAVEEAAFALQPNQYSQVIETPIGFHIVQVIERGDHVYAPDVRHMLQEQALTGWLDEQRSQGQIEILLPD